MVREGKEDERNLYLRFINHCMQISKYCDMTGAALDRREWLQFQGIVFRVKHVAVNFINIMEEEKKSLLFLS